MEDNKKTRKQKQYMGGYYFGIRRVYAEDDADAGVIYRKVVDDNKFNDEDLQDVGSKVTRDHFDKATQEFYKEKGKKAEYCIDTDNFYVEVDVPDNTPERVEVDEEPVLPADAPAMKAEAKAQALKEAQEQAAENPSKQTPDADEIERAESLENSQLPPEEQVKNESASVQDGETQDSVDEEGEEGEDEEGEVDEGESTIEQDIQGGIADATILGKYDKDEFVEAAESHNIESKDKTKQALLKEIRKALKK